MERGAWRVPWATKSLEYNCFKMLCQFLLYNKANQLYGYICPLPPESPSHPSRSSQSTKLNSLCCPAASHQLLYTQPCLHLSSVQLSSVQSLSHVQLFATPRTAAHQASLSITNSWSLLKLMSIETVMPSNHLILCRSLLLPHSLFPRITVFSNESVLHIRCPKYWSFSFSISPSNEQSGLISFRMDWFGLLAVQGTLKSLLQYHSPKTINSQALSFLYSPTLIKAGSPALQVDSLPVELSGKPCQYYSPNSSTSFFIPLYPQVHSLCLHLYSYPANRLSCTIFLDSIYMH